MEGGSNSTCSRIMAFGDTTNGPFGPMMIIPHPPSSSSNALFLPLTTPPPLTPSTHLLDHQTLNKSHSATASSSCMVFDTQMRMDTNPNGGGCYFMDNTTNVVTDTVPPCSIKSKIMSHPHYPRLLAAYVNCQKVGAPPEVVARLEEACATSAATVGMLPTAAGGLGEDPALDQFMEAYCEMLSKYEQELSKPLKEAMLFLQRVEYQFKALNVSSTNSAFEGMDRNESCEEDVDANINFIDPQAEDQELKGQLLRKYSGYLGSLKQEFMKKRKKGKLPKEARQQLLDWWSRHYKWPYPSESQKLALAESTGLDQKQINNWFINQRKRHWKPSEEMQLVVMNGAHSQYYMDNVLGNPFPMDISPQML